MGETMTQSAAEAFWRLTRVFLEDGGCGVAERAGFRPVLTRDYRRLLEKLLR